MLTLAASNGLHRVVAALLARGANPDVRDGNGYTALLHAALQGQLKTFQLLLVKGADPAIRCLSGFTVLDVAPEDTRETFSQILLNTPRTRPQLPSRRSTASSTSSTSWDISSASYYESEVDAKSSQQHLSAPASRRQSEQLSSAPKSSDEQQVVEAPVGASSTAVSMYAWRDALAAQIQHFQSNVQAHMPQFPLQLPPLPTLPEDSSFGRRINSLMPGRACSPPPNADACPPPPAYSELFPEGPEGSAKGTELSGVQESPVADRKCNEVPDTANKPSNSKMEIVDACERQSKLSELVDIPTWFWTPLAVIVSSVLLQNFVPHFSSRKDDLGPASTPSRSALAC